MRLPISFCVVTKDEPLLPGLIACVRDHVAEICILDSSTGPARAAEAKALADVYAREDEGLQDFAELRNRSFALGTQRLRMWGDADDEIVGLEYLAEAIDLLGAQPKANRGALLVCPYEYAFDDEGRCIQRQRRERVLFRPELFHWEHPAHETLASKDGAPYVPVIDDRIVWRHRRKTASSSGRALRILTAHAAEHPELLAEENPWLLANLAHEHFVARNFDEARAFFERYVATPGDREPRALAHVKLCDIAIGKGEWPAARTHAAIACALAPRLLTTGYACGRAWFLSAMMDSRIEREEALETSLGALHHALSQTGTTSQGVNPRERFEVHGLASTIAEMRGEATLAHQHAAGQLIECPSDPAALLRERETRAPAMPGGFAEGLERFEKSTGRLDIVIACGDSLTPWNPHLVKRGANVYGSELAVIAMAARLAARGHRVRVYNACGVQGLYDDVEYRHWTTAPGLESADSCDVLVAWRDARGLEALRAKTRLLWVHDVKAFALTSTRALLADRVLALSAWHKANLVKEHALHPDHVHVTRNGVDRERFRAALASLESPTAACPGCESWREIVPLGGNCPRCGWGCAEKDVAAKVFRHPHRAIYSSSPDRGLLLLLDLWPAIRARIPDAELRVFYGHEQWRAGAAKAGGQTPAYIVATLERRLAETPGVTYCGRVPPEDLAREMAQAGVWAYPTWFDETSCMGAMEAQAARLRVIATRQAALGETVIAGTLLDGDPLTKEYQDAFVAAVIDEMRHGDARRAWDAAAGILNPIDVFDWDGVTTGWLALFEELLAEARAGFVPPYEPYLTSAEAA